MITVSQLVERAESLGWFPVWTESGLAVDQRHSGKWVRHYSLRDVNSTHALVEGRISGPKVRTHETCGGVMVDLGKWFCNVCSHCGRRDSKHNPAESTMGATLLDHTLSALNFCYCAKRPLHSHFDDDDETYPSGVTFIDGDLSYFRKAAAYQVVHQVRVMESGLFDAVERAISFSSDVNSLKANILSVRFPFFEVVMESPKSTDAVKIGYSGKNYKYDMKQSSAIYTVGFFDKANIAEFVPKSLQSDKAKIADSAHELSYEEWKKTRKRVRMGKRVRHKVEGLCYLSFVPKKMREKAEICLGKRPCVKDTADLYRDLNIVPRDHRIELIKDGSHVHWQPKWPSARQMRFLENVLPAQKIGAEDWDDAIEDPFYELFVEFDHMALFKSGVHSPVPDAVARDDDPIDIKMIEIDACVKGSGDCWKKCGMYFIDEVEAMGEDDMNLTVDAFIQCVQNIEKKGVNYTKQNKVVLVKLIKQEDGDWHIDDAMMGVVARNKNGAIAKKRRAEGWQELDEAIAVMQTDRKRLVAAPAVSALDSAVSSLVAPDSRAAMERLIQPDLRNGVDEVAKLCPYKIPQKNQHKMEQLAIPWSKYQVVDHPHPIHAAIRRWCYMQALPKYIRSDCTFLGMKPEHFNMLKRAVDALHGEGTYNLYNVNPIVDLKDIGRYAGTNTVPEAVWDIPKIETPMLFCDESGHYLSPAWMVQIYKQNPNLRCIGMSNIFPLLALEFSQSPEPEYVNWRVVKGAHGPKLIYIPEEDEGGKYEQPFDPTMTLLRRVEDDKGECVWNGGVVEKKGNLRLQMFYSYALSTPEYIVECEYAMMNIPRLFRGQPETQPILVDWYIKMFQYGKVLPAAKDEVQWGKLRTFFRDQKMYCPPGDMDWLVKVVWQAIKICATCDLQPKNYSNLADEVYYKTVGHLRRIWDVAVPVRYANRNRKLISYPDPVRTWPTLRVEVNWFTDGSTYGTSWRLDAPEPVGFWKHFRLWLTSMGQNFVKTDDRFDAEFDDNGRVIFPFIHNAYYTRKTIGLTIIKESQRRDFNKIFEKKNERPPFVRKPHKIYAPPLPIDDYDESELPPARDDLVITEAEEILEDAYTEQEVASDSGSDTVTEGSTSTIIAEPPGKYEFEATVRHCSLCPSYENAVEMGLTPVMQRYEEMCDRLHANRAEFGENNRLMLVHENLIKRMYLRRRILNSRDEPMLPASPNIRNHEKVVLSNEDLRDKIDTYREQTQEMVKFMSPVHFDIEDVQMVKKYGNYQKRKENWERLYERRPQVATKTMDAVRETLWDLLYPKTVGHRYNKVPYANVVSYPTNVEYPENDCLLVAMADGLGQTTEEMFFRALAAYPRNEIEQKTSLSLNIIDPIALHYGVSVAVRSPKGVLIKKYGVDDSRVAVDLIYGDGHLKCVSKRPTLVIQKVKPQQTGRPAQQRFVNRLEAWPALQWYDWKVEEKRAMDYVRALIAGTTGLLGTPLNMDKLNEWMSICDLSKDVKKKMCVVMGDPGCRKSSRPQRLCNDQDAKRMGVFAAVLPTSVLAQDWRNKLDAPAKNKDGRGMPGNMVTTFEKALAYGHTGNVVFFDENKYPKGYIALYNLLHPDVKYNVFLCDPWQTSWHEPNADCLLNDPDILGEAEYYMKYAKMYLVGTWRLPVPNANFWRMPTFNKSDGGFMFTNVMPTIWQDLRPHFGKHIRDETLVQLWQAKHEFHAAHFDTVWAEQLRGGEVNSFAGSQGLTMPLCIIQIDEKVLRGTDPRMIYTPMTRSRWILFVISWPNNGRAEALEEAHPVFSKLRHYRVNYVPGKKTVIDPEYTCSIRELMSSPQMGNLKQVLSGPPKKVQNRDFLEEWYPDDFWEHFIDPDEKRAGARLSYDDEAYEEAYQFWPFIDQTEEPELPDPGLLDLRIPEPKLPTSIPKESREMFTEYYNSLNQERYQREILDFREGYSFQLPDEIQRRKDAGEIIAALVKKEPGQNRRLKRQQVMKRLEKDPFKSPIYFTPELYNWGLDQRSNDKVSFLAAMQQRIRYASIQENLTQIHDQSPFGYLCWDRFKKYMNWTNDVPFSPLEFDEAVQAFQFRRGDRSQALKKMSLNRAEPDFPMMMTAKTQWKLKDRIQTEAKPLQPVMIHADEYLFKFGPYGIYLLEKIMQHKPDYWHFHAKKTPEDFAEWVTRHFIEDEVFHMNDQKGQDQAVQGWAVVLFEELMRHFNLPEEIIEEFRTDKIGKKLGRRIMAIMTDSGEVWTYLINTVSSTARECAMFDLPPGLPMACGGDDIMRRDYGPLAFDYLQVRDQDPSIDKRFKSNRGEFCSFMVKKGRLTKDPIILLKRFLGKLSAGKGEQSVLGYFHLWAFNYNQGDYLVDIFDEEELQAHNILTTIMFNLKKEQIRQKPDWSLLKIDGSIPEEVDALAIFAGVKDTIIDRIENEAQFMYNVPAGLQEFQVVYENIQSMLVPEYGE